MTGSVVLRGRKSFLLLFFKKEELPYLAELTDQRSLDTQVGIIPAR
jgi:hypothetical protein